MKELRTIGVGRHHRALLRALSIPFAFIGVSALVWADLRHEQIAPPSSDAPAADPHAELLRTKEYPSAADCKTCHPYHYQEWSVSPHAYAVLSPVFNSMHGTIVKETNGTSGDFCIRCHTPVGMELGEPVFMSAMDRAPVSREGVTCIACHRRAEPFGKVSGRIGITAGDLFSPVKGPTGNRELRRVIESGDYHVTTDPDVPGRIIHTNVVKMSQFTEASFCGSCHDVNNVPGFRLEEAFSEYKASPAAKKGLSCQDCHMGTIPGEAAGYLCAPVAVVGGEPTQPRKRTNHMFVGPDYSIVHPGVFPHNPAAADLATIREWLSFNVDAGWGSDDFEDQVVEETVFPERWAEVGDRYEARDILEENLALLAEADEARQVLLKNGYQLGEVRFRRKSSGDLTLRVEVRNGTDGHNVPTGFDAERLVFLHVTVHDASGRVVFESGDFDPPGDVRDTHSVYGHNGELPLDEFLFSLQSRFLTRMIRGGEREQVIPINFSRSPVPFVRPSSSATLLVGNPEGGRKHRKSIPPLAGTWAEYRLDAADLAGTTGPYTAHIKLIAGMVPVNLVHAIQDVGFDFGLSPRAVADAVVEGHKILWEREAIIEQPGDLQSPVQRK